MSSEYTEEMTASSGEDKPLLVGRYRPIRALGQGGMGSVWLAEDTALDNHLVAIKMLPTILASNKRALAQLKSEALVSLRLTHPNIATLRSFEENGGSPFLVMDYIDGQTLDDRLAEHGVLSEAETRALLGPVAAALDYAHEKGVVHRDVKPSNVMIAKDGTPFVLDFGIAREIQETMTRVTGKLSSGTLLYMSPEQLCGSPAKPAQDVYSFAATVYECLAGMPPFHRGQIEFQIMNSPPPPLASGSVLAQSVLRGLSKNPAQRPANCRAVLGEVASGGHETEQKFFADFLASSAQRTAHATRLALKAAEENRLADAFRLSEEADAADVGICFLRGFCHQHGEGVEMDLDAARTEYRVAAEGGHRGAQYNLASMLLRGEGGAVDICGAVRWFTAAAEGGEIQAALALAKIYDEGRDVPRNASKAFAFLMQAYHAGAKDCAEVIGAFCAQNEDSGLSPNARRKFLEAAAAAGDANAKAVLERLSFAKPRRAAAESKARTVRGLVKLGVAAALLFIVGVVVYEVGSTRARRRQELEDRRRSEEIARQRLEEELLDELFSQIKVCLQSCRSPRETIVAKLNKDGEGLAAYKKEFDAVCALQPVLSAITNSTVAEQALEGARAYKARLTELHDDLLRAVWARKTIREEFAELKKSAAAQLTLLASHRQDPEGLDAHLKEALKASQSVDAELHFASLTAASNKLTDAHVAWQTLTNELAWVEANVLVRARARALRKELEVETSKIESLLEEETTDFTESQRRLLRSKFRKPWEDAGKAIKDGRFQEALESLAEARHALDGVSVEIARSRVRIAFRELKNRRRIELARLRPFRDDPEGFGGHFKRADHAARSADVQNLPDDLAEASNRVETVRAALTSLTNELVWLESNKDYRDKIRMLRGTVEHDLTVTLGKVRDNARVKDRYAEGLKFFTLANLAYGQGDLLVAEQKLEAARKKLDEAVSAVPEELVPFAAGQTRELVFPDGKRLTVVWVPPGKDLQGRAIKGFWLGQTEVTQAQWNSVMHSRPSSFTGDERRPVERVTWNSCKYFCSKLGPNVRLPTEREWEYACRAGGRGNYGRLADGQDGRLGDMGWFDGNSVDITHPVGTKVPNAWGLYDMHGNVWEWCDDSYGSSRVTRGGCWSDDFESCRSVSRNLVDASGGGPLLGFRILCEQD